MHNLHKNFHIVSTLYNALEEYRDARHHTQVQQTSRRDLLNINYFNSYNIYKHSVGRETVLTTSSLYYDNYTLF